MIKNYTSSVPVDRTVAKIEAALVSGGAEDIHKTFKNGLLEGVSFQIFDPTVGKKLAIRLPANHEAVFDALRGRVKKPRAGTLDKLREQASRTAWKIIQDWVEVQISLIQLGQAEFLQVFLPYVWDGERTFYTALKSGGFKLLAAKN